MKKTEQENQVEQILMQHGKFKFALMKLEQGFILFSVTSNRHQFAPSIKITSIILFNMMFNFIEKIDDGRK